jgi:DNA (cytosine-5)-methyltransferase 1
VRGKQVKATRTRQKPTAIDLFSGCGGLSLGLTKAGFRVLGAIEMSPPAVETYRANHERVKVWQGDIRSIPASDVMRELGLKPGQLDLLAGCPPCQGFSSLRTRNGAVRNKDRRNGLVREMLRFARVFRPKAIMMENVPRLGNKKAFNELCTGLRKLGYQIKWDVKNMAQYGVPQRRKRLILVAGMKFEISFADEAKKKTTVRTAIGDLRNGRRDRLHHLPESRSEKVLKLIRTIPKDGGSRTDLPRRRQLRCHKDFDGFRDIYGRMAWDEVSPTITSGCFNPSKGRFLHPQHNRAITLREAAILQSFPRRYRFPIHHGKEALALMIGNALPPEFIRRQALAIASSLKSKATR